MAVEAAAAEVVAAASGVDPAHPSATREAAEAAEEEVAEVAAEAAVATEPSALAGLSVD